MRKCENFMSMYHTPYMHLNVMRFVRMYSLSLFLLTQQENPSLGALCPTCTGGIKGLCRDGHRTEVRHIAVEAPMKYVH